MSIFRYLVIFTLTGLVVIGTSLLWSNFTTTPRPQVLNVVREQVLKTQIGQNIASILEPITISSLTASVAGSMTSAVSEKAQEVVANQLINELSKKYNDLPDSQKQELQELICKP